MSDHSPDPGDRPEPRGAPPPPPDPTRGYPSYPPGGETGPAGPPGYPVQPAYGYGPPVVNPGSGRALARPDSEERTWALMAHIGTLVSAWFALGLIAPLITMLAKGNTSPFVRRHSVESLNFQISLLIYSAVGSVVGFLAVLLTLGIGLLVVLPVALAAAIAALVVIVIATIRAANGEEYRYPLTIRLVK